MLNFLTIFILKRSKPCSGHFISTHKLANVGTLHFSSLCMLDGKRGINSLVKLLLVGRTDQFEHFEARNIDVTVTILR